jgi:hypothetical protein
VNTPKGSLGVVRATDGTEEADPAVDGRTALADYSYRSDTVPVVNAEVQHRHGHGRLSGLPPIAGVVASVGFAVVAVYQVLLALGTAFSGAAWGGATLTPALRLASAVSAVVLVLAALIVLGRVGYGGSRLPAAIFRWGTWVLVVGMTLSALANFASHTTGERFFLGPSALLLAILCLAVTRAPAR